jgi:hypothetical protein
VCKALFNHSALYELNQPLTFVPDMKNPTKFKYIYLLNYPCDKTDEEESLKSPLGLWRLVSFFVILKKT